MYLLRCDVQVPLSKGKVLILQDNFWEGVDSSKGSSDRITNEVSTQIIPPSFFASSCLASSRHRVAEDLEVFF